MSEIPPWTLHTPHTATDTLTGTRVHACDGFPCPAWSVTVPYMAVPRYRSLGYQSYQPFLHVLYVLLVRTRWAGFGLCLGRIMPSVSSSSVQFCKTEKYLKLYSWEKNPWETGKIYLPDLWVEPCLETISFIAIVISFIKTNCVLFVLLRLMIFSISSDKIMLGPDPVRVVNLKLQLKYVTQILLSSLTWVSAGLIDFTS